MGRDDSWHVGSWMIQTTACAKSDEPNSIKFTWKWRKWINIVWFWQVQVWPFIGDIRNVLNRACSVPNCDFGTENDREWKWIIILKNGEISGRNGKNHSYDMEQTKQRWTQGTEFCCSTRCVSLPFRHDVCVWLVLISNQCLTKYDHLM